jgi:aminomuconate-semialdehyde/2-hydroxymuconate-6-semialdehyde dehydrogenase
MRIAHFIGGEPTEPASGAWLENVEPATGAAYGEIADGDERDVERAVAAAADAFPGWSRTPVEERARLLLRLADLVEENLEELARLESIDNGKPVRFARTVDIPRAALNFRFFAMAATQFASESHATDDRAINVTLRRPRGVAGLISPWNLPLYLLTWKIAPALASGNTAVAKPSEVTPATAYRLAELTVEAGLPPGVLNLVQGLGPRVGEPLVTHPRVPAISFTGGTATGAAIAAATATQFKKLALEMGGKNPNVVFADADLDEAVAESVRAAFANQGQICLCGSRLLVERSIHDEFRDRFLERAAALRVGDPLEEDTDQGALVSAAHRDKVESCVALAREEGGEILLGGRRPEDLPERVRDGFFLEPTVVGGLGPACRTNTEEIFGPVVSILPFEDEVEAVAIANAVEYGLAASVWTRDIERALRVADRIQAGTVWVNCWLLRDLRVPFGGVKRSGLGREGGLEALRFFTEQKNVCLRHRPDLPEETDR